MQQDPFLYTHPSFSQGDARLQCQNIGHFPMQPSISPWSPHHISSNIQNDVINCSNVSPSAMNIMGHSQSNNIITPVSTSVYTTTPTFSWAHTVPTFMPWGPGGKKIEPDPLVRFTGTFPPDPCTSQTATSWELLNLSASQKRSNLHLKRKPDVDSFETVSPKQCATEERMAARMKELHISNHYSIPPESISCGSVLNDSHLERAVTNLQQLETMFQESELSNNEARSLILAPEIKKLVAPEKIFSSTFLNKVERPSMAVVVWQPQKNVIEEFKNSSAEERNERTIRNDSSSETNNNISPLSLQILCNQHLTFDVPMDPSSTDVVMDTYSSNG